MMQELEKMIHFQAGMSKAAGMLAEPEAKNQTNAGYMWCHNSAMPNLIAAVPRDGFPFNSPYIFLFNLTAEQ